MLKYFVNLSDLAPMHSSKKKKTTPKRKKISLSISFRHLKMKYFGFLNFNFNIFFKVKTKTLKHSNSEQDISFHIDPFFPQFFDLLEKKKEEIIAFCLALLSFSFAQLPENRKIKHRFYPVSYGFSQMIPFSINISPASLSLLKISHGKTSTFVFHKLIYIVLT